MEKVETDARRELNWTGLGQNLVAPPEKIKRNYMIVEMIKKNRIERKLLKYLKPMRLRTF